MFTSFTQWYVRQASKYRQTEIKSLTFLRKKIILETFVAVFAMQKHTFWQLSWSEVTGDSQSYLVVQRQLCLACVNLVLPKHNSDPLGNGAAIAWNATELTLCLRVAVELDFCLYCSVLSTVLIIILKEYHISGWYIFHAACVCLWSSHLRCMSPFNNVLYFFFEGNIFIYNPS